MKDKRVGLARTLYIRCIYRVFGRETTKCTVIYGVYIRFRPTLPNGVTVREKGRRKYGTDGRADPVIGFLSFIHPLIRQDTEARKCAGHRTDVHVCVCICVCVCVCVCARLHNKHIQTHIIT